MLVQTAYETLGVDREATPQDIKRAYIKLIRVHTPEKDEAQFKLIREAYEMLKDGHPQEDAPTFDLKPEEKEYYQKIMKSLGEGNYAEVKAGAALASATFPNQPAFLYYLGIGQRKTGNTGRAINNLKLLVEQDPDNPWYQRELGLAYFDRDWKKKAFEAMSVAVEQGVHDPVFIATYVRCCNHEGYMRPAWNGVCDMFRDQVPLNRNTAEAVFFLLQNLPAWEYDEKLTRGLLNFVKDVVNNHLDLVTQPYMIYVALIRINRYGDGDVKKETFFAFLPEALEKLSLLDKRGSENDMAVARQYRAELISLYLDKALGVTFKLAATVGHFVFMYQPGKKLPSDLEIDNRWYMCNDREGLIKSLDFLKKCVPAFPEYYRADIGRLEKEKSEAFRLQKNLKKQFDRDGGFERPNKYGDEKLNYLELSDRDFYGYGHSTGRGSTSMDDMDYLDILLELMRRGKGGRGNGWPFF